MNKEKLVEYKKLSEELSKLEENLQKKKRDFEYNIIYLKTAIEEKKFQLQEPKRVLEEEAKEEFSKTGKKKLDGGIGIREKKKLIYDEKEAFEWAKNTGTCLQLDKKKFEKVAPEMTDFVKEEKETQVTFPKEIKI